MHVAVDALGIKHSGGATILLDFLHAALDDPRVSLVTVFCSPRAVRRFDLPLSPKLHSVEHPLAEHSYLARIWWFQVSLARKCRRIGADVLVCMVGSGRVHDNPPHVTFIQQSLPFSVEALQYCGPRMRVQMRVLKELFRSSCDTAQHIVVQTPTMKRWVSEHFDIPANRVDVVLPDVHLERFSSDVRASDRSDLDATDNLTILYVGNDAPYKNVNRVIEGIELMRKTTPNVTLQVTWSIDHPICQQPGVECLGFLSPDRLVQAYRQATILVMPSLVETVGLPLLEAMSLNVPVLAADRPYARDVCNDAALYFDPLSVEDFARKAHLLTSSEDLRRHLIEKGKLLTERRSLEASYARMVDIILNTVNQRPVASQQGMN